MPLMKRSLFSLILVVFGVIGSLRAQDSRLAQQYFQDGEYEKASVLFGKLYEQNEDNEYFFDRYIDCLIALEQYDECEKVVKKQLKKFPKNIQLYVTYGRLLESQYKDNEALEQYQAAIKKLSADRFEIIKLANAFAGQLKYDLSIETYERGGKLLGDERLFSYNLGDLYRKKGDTPKMIEHFLNSLSAGPDRMGTIQMLFQRYLLPEDFKDLQTQLYSRIQKDPDAYYYPELLTWVFVQSKDYTNAFRQVKALDRKMKEGGGRIYRLAEIAANDGDYDAAIEGYEYIVEEKGSNSSFYLDAKREALRCRRNKLVEGYHYTVAELRDLEQQYQIFLQEVGRNRYSASLMTELADLQAFYINDLDKSIATLLEVIDLPGIEPGVQAKAKLSLGDFYLMKDEIWEATLLYSQVDKAFKEDLLGHEARFRNAKLSYYDGDFQWAQAQFDVLKASTSKLIANDALDLSVFIMDNLGLDTSALALKLYAGADLLVFQNRFDEAFAKLDTLRKGFPKHALEDDLLYMEAQIFMKKRDFQQAADRYQRIVDIYPEEIRADNAIYALGDLYEHQLQDIPKAMALYEKLFTEYSGSTFAVEARKRFRKLRGDNI